MSTERKYEPPSVHETMARWDTKTGLSSKEGPLTTGPQTPEHRAKLAESVRKSTGGHTTSRRLEEPLQKNHREKIGKGQRRKYTR